MAAAAWFAVRIHAGTTVKLNEFLLLKSEETVRDFISNQGMKKEQLHLVKGHNYEFLPLFF